MTAHHPTGPHGACELEARQNTGLVSAVSSALGALNHKVVRSCICGLENNQMPAQ